MEAEIAAVHARQVLDSRGRPTVEAEVTCRGARAGRAIVPAGASTGRAEAHELRDGEPRWGGRGVSRAVAQIREVIGPALLGRNAADQSAIDRLLIELDATPNKARLGANALLAVSLATAYAAAEALGISIIEHLSRLWQQHSGTTTRPSIPLPMVNMISGGCHAGRQLEFQDVLIIPVGAQSFSEALEWIVAVYHRLGGNLRMAGYEGTLVGDEGGYGPRLPNNEAAIQAVLEAIVGVGLQPGQEMALALDVAATHFHANNHYVIPTLRRAPLTPEELTDYLEQLVQKYPLLSLEDPLAEDDWPGWRRLTERLTSRVQLIGDDLFVTHPQRLQRGVQEGVANAILIKPNQIGTLTETLQTMQLARQQGYQVILSARSGETEDVTIADLAVATAASQIKIGSVARSERLAKYNQLLRWEERSAGRWPFAGARPFERWLTKSGRPCESR